MSKINRREQNILIVGGTLIFIMLFLNYFLQPQWDKYNNDKASLAGLSSKAEMLKAEKEKKLKEKLETVEELKGQVRSLRSQLPVSEETAGFLGFLVSAADAAEVNLAQLNVDGIKENKEVKGTSALPVNIKVEGSYLQVRAFTEKLENLKRLNHITSMRISRDEDTGVIEGDFSLKVYSWAKGDQSLNDPLTIPRSPKPGKNDPYNSVSTFTRGN